MSQTCPSMLLLVLAATLLLLPQIIQAKAELSGTTINVWSGSPAVQHEDNCTTLLADIPAKVKSCTSNFASACISVDALINITRGSAGNWTNFSVNGCELRMNRSAADGASNFIINNWGNFTVINSNITTNDSAKHSAIIIRANSNFSMSNSFVSEMGWSISASQRGLELNSPTFTFSNNTLVNSYNGITLLSGASGSMLTNINASSNSYYGIYLYTSSSNTLANITANSNTLSGIYLLSSSSNNTLTNINIWNCSSGGSYACIYFGASRNNSFIKGTVNLTRNLIIDMQSGSGNNIFQDIAFINTTLKKGAINLTTTSNATFLNCSFTGVTESVSSNSQLIRQWYVDVYANTSKGSGLGDVNISFRNSTGTLLNYSASNSSGWIARLNLTAYINGSGTLYNYSDYVVNATRSGFAEASKNLTLSENQINKAFFISLTETGIIVTPITADGFQATYSTPSLEFNATDSFHSTLNCSLYVASSLHTYNATTVNATHTSLSSNSLADGSHSWYINCTDAEGNYATSTAKIIIIKTGGHSIQIVLQLGETSGKVYIPGTGEFASLSLSNASYASPAHDYIASYLNGILKSLVFVGDGFVSLGFARSGTDMHSIGLDQNLAGARALVAFTRGDWNSVENRIKEIESGKFFSYPSPAFGFGLGNLYAIKLLLSYTDIKLLGNLTLQAGRQGLTFAYNGTTSGNKQNILVTQATQ